MPVRIQINVRSEGPAGGSLSPRRVFALLGGMVLVVGLCILLGVNIRFAEYALTGFSWDEADGRVVSSHTTSTPRIQFVSRDGASHVFDENYIQMCAGRRSFCFIRNFTPGQSVPVVYDPTVPERAFVHDWALSANVINWFAEAGAGLIFATMIGLVVAKST